MRSFLTKTLVLLLSLGSLALGDPAPRKDGEDETKAPVTVDLPAVDPALSGIEAKLPPVEATLDDVSKEIAEFRKQTRLLFNNQKFDELEALADQLRKSKARFGNGSWKLANFYDCQTPSKEAPESLWELHAQKHKSWEASKPDSITARVAHAKFLVDYAWHARGHGWASTVTQTGWQLFDERLVEALKVLDDSIALKDKCPIWWRERMTVALGQGWSRAKYDKVFEAAKILELEYWGYDIARAWYLMPRWHGEPGDWEAAAAAEAIRPGSLGAEGYARAVIHLTRYYNNIFKETKASWADTSKGLEILHKKYPDSLEILSDYCKLACLQRDRPLAKKLFDEIGGRMYLGVWKKQDYFVGSRDWAYAK